MKMMDYAIKIRLQSCITDQMKPLLILFINVNSIEQGNALRKDIQTNWSLTLN
jgi:hypothetical protein